MCLSLKYNSPHNRKLSNEERSDEGDEIAKEVFAEEDVTEADKKRWLDTYHRKFFGYSTLLIL